MKSRDTEVPWVNTRLLTRRLVVRISAMASLYSFGRDDGKTEERRTKRAEKRRGPLPGTKIGPKIVCFSVHLTTHRNA